MGVVGLRHNGVTLWSTARYILVRVARRARQRPEEKPKPNNSEDECSRL